jgi:hypothetical protein
MKRCLALFWLLLAGTLSGCGNLSGDDVPVGFFVPRGVPSEIVGKVRFGMLNVATPEQVEHSFAKAANSSFRVILDLGPLIARPVAAEELSMVYVDSSGVERRKVFAPPPIPKVLGFPPDAQLIDLIQPYLEIMQRNRSNAHAVFLADEPYQGVENCILTFGFQLGWEKSTLKNPGEVRHEALSCRLSSRLCDRNSAALPSLQRRRFLSHAALRMARERQRITVPANYPIASGCTRRN